jgi:GNAT superfamily N-acetyltransferase
LPASGNGRDRLSNGANLAVNRQDILALFDREMRAEARLEAPGYRIERRPELTRIISPTPAAHDNCVIYSNLVRDMAASAIDEQIAFYRSNARDFEWKLYDHDRPADLGDLLRARGFAPESGETVVVADLANNDETVLPGVEIAVHRIDGPDRLSAIVDLQNQVWGEDHGWLAAALARELAADPTSLQVLLAERRGAPEACSWMRLHRGTRFASVWGAATLPSFRRRGIYSALVGRHRDEARRHGFRFMTADTNEHSRPILRRLGFAALTGARGYLWRFSASAPE